MRPREIDTLATRLLDEDIRRIMKGLKSVAKEEHTPLVVGLEKTISAQERIQQEYIVHFTELR